MEYWHSYKGLRWEMCLQPPQHWGFNVFMALKKNKQLLPDTTEISWLRWFIHPVRLHIAVVYSSNEVRFEVEAWTCITLCSSFLSSDSLSVASLTRQSPLGFTPWITPVSENQDCLVVFWKLCWVFDMLTCFQFCWLWAKTRVVSEQQQIG